MNDERLAGVKAEAARNEAIKRMERVGVDLVGGKTKSGRTRDQWRVVDPAMDLLGRGGEKTSDRTESYFRDQDRVVNVLLDELPEEFFDGKGELKREADSLIRKIIDNEVTGYRGYERFNSDGDQELIKLNVLESVRRAEMIKELEKTVSRVFSERLGVVVYSPKPEEIKIEIDDGKWKRYDGMNTDLRLAGDAKWRKEHKEGYEKVRERLEKAGVAFREDGSPRDEGDTGAEDEAKSKDDMSEGAVLLESAMLINDKKRRGDLILEALKDPKMSRADRKRAVDALNLSVGVDMTVAAEAKEVMEADDLRAEFYMILNEQLFSENASVDPVSTVFVNDWLSSKGIGIRDKKTRDEFFNYMALMNMRAAVRHFEDNPSILSKVIGKEGVEGQGEEKDTKWKRAYLAGYQDRQILGVLEAAETDGYKKANISNALKMFAEEAIAARSGTPDALISQWALFYRSNVPAKPEFELNYISAVAEELGITEYEASVGFAMFEALLEPEYNSRHPLYSITHPREHATALKTSIWWGSIAWWSPEITGDPSGQACAMPDRLWAPAGVMYPNLMTEILAGNGVDEVLEIIENPVKTGEGILTKNFGDIVKAMNLHRKLTDIGPGTPGARMETEMLWQIKDLMGVLMVPADDAVNKKMNYFRPEGAMDNLLAVSKVFFWEISTRNPNCRKMEDRGMMRAVSPKGIFDRLAQLSIRRDGLAFFELPKVVGALEVRQGKSFGDLRSYVSGIIRSFINSRMNVPEGEGSLVHFIESSLPTSPVTSVAEAERKLMKAAGKTSPVQDFAETAYSARTDAAARLAESARSDTNPITSNVKKLTSWWLKS